MSPRAERRALVVVRDGPASERGWLALRTALALGLGGYEVDVWLEDRAVVYAAASLDVQAWFAGEPQHDVAGLLDDLGAAVHVNAQWHAITEAVHGAALRLRDGVRLADAAELRLLYEHADLVVRP